VPPHVLLASGLDFGILYHEDKNTCTGEAARASRSCILFVPVPMMNIRIVRVGVNNGFVRVGMGMRFTGRGIWPVGVLMMGIVGVRMRV
jgi:hypothetical protein